MLRRLARRQTLASFDYQWADLPDGDAMLSDPWFRSNVDRILVDELLGIEREWFQGRSVLDAGCGAGRWTVGLLRLGCSVLAIDASAAAIERTLAHSRQLVPEAVETGRLQVARVDLLDLPPQVQERRFDLVFCFGVLHHTGDTRAALMNITSLVRPDGLVFLYLYGSPSVGPAKRLFLGCLRMGLAPLSFSAKRKMLSRLFPERDTHQAFDLLSPLINQRLSFEQVSRWLHEAGFSDVQRSLVHTELYLRAARPHCSARPFRLPPSPPFWFERYKRASCASLP
jgi:SAM-dependent methyltransferase